MDVSFLHAKMRYPDPDAHEAGCLSQEAEVESSDLTAGYIDLFCSCHRYTEPKVLRNGTDIAWPAGWSQEQANEWRAAKGILEPGVVAHFLGASDDGRYKSFSRPSMIKRSIANFLKTPF